MKKVCRTCKHVELHLWMEPCNTCCADDMWAPPDSALILEAVELEDLEIGEVYLIRGEVCGYFLQIKTHRSEHARNTKIWRLP